MNIIHPLMGKIIRCTNHLIFPPNVLNTFDFQTLGFIKRRGRFLGLNSNRESP